MEKRQEESKIDFTCKRCKKTIQVQADIYEKQYKNERICLTCRQNDPCETCPDNPSKENGQFACMGTFDACKKKPESCYWSK